MKLALIAMRKVKNIEQYIPNDCTVILTNIQELTFTDLPVIYNSNLDELIKNADYVTALCFRKIKRRPPIIPRCKRYAKSFEFVFID